MKKIPHLHPNIRQRQGGFISAMSAIMIGLPVMAMLMTYFAHVVTEQAYLAKAQNGGGKSNLVNIATNTYMSTAYLVLTDSTSDTEVQKMIAAGNLPDWVKNVKRIGDPAGPDYNLCPAHDCIRITTADLRQAGLPSIGTTDTDVYGNSFDIIIRRTGTNGFYDLGAIIATSGTFKRVNEGPQPNLTDLWTAVGVVGTDGAITARATQSHVNGGYTGSVGDLVAFGIGDKENNKVGWFAKASDWPNIKSEGQLVTRAGYLSSAWASYVRLDGTRPMTGNFNLGDNQIVNVKNIQWNAKVTYGAICADSDGKAVPDDATGQYRFGAGSIALWANPPGGSTNISSQMLSCLKNPDGTYRWAKPTAPSLTMEEIAAGMMDGWVTFPVWICGVGINTLPNAGISWPGAYDFRSFTRFKYKRGKLFMQVYTGAVQQVPGGAWPVQPPGQPWDASKWVDLHLAGVNAGTAFKQDNNGFQGPLGPYYAPMQTNLPIIGTSCVNGSNQIWKTATDVQDLGSFAQPYGDSMILGQYGANGGAAICNANGCELGWEVSKVSPILTQANANQTATGEVPTTNCVPDGLGGTICSGGTTTVTLPVTRGYSTHNSRYGISFPFYTREDPSYP